MKRTLTIAIGLMLSLLVAHHAGAKKYDFEFDVKAVGEYDFNGKKFRVEPLYADTKRDDKAFLEFSKPVISYFKLCGADWAEETDSLDFVLQVGWGSNLTQDRVEYTPHYTTDTYRYSYYDMWGNLWDVTSWDDRITGYTEERIKEWTKYVKVRATDYRSPDHDRVLWDMMATTRDTKGATIGEAFYYMLYGSCEYIGHSTGGTQSFKMTTRCESDLVYDWIRSGTLCYSTTTIYPEFTFSEYCDGKGLDIYCIERLDDRLVVTLEFNGKGTYVMPKEFAMSYFDDKGEEHGEWPVDVKGIELGKASKVPYFQVVFPPIPKEINRVNFFDNNAKEGDKKIVQYNDVYVR